MTWGGLGKSGSPISRWITLRPCASSARARTRTSKADSTPMRDMRSASFILCRLAEDAGCRLPGPTKDLQLLSLAQSTSPWGCLFRSRRSQCSRAYNGEAPMPAKRKTKPSKTGVATGGKASAARELPEFIDRLYRKIQNAPPGKKKWAAEAVDELSRLMDLSEKLLADAASVRGLAIVRAQS